ncbi:uroporphyrinogen-III synthase [Altererythrobacter marinus]|uniref:Uroporphyrinogen-III synthase n=1 Tax=Pelagerythrobacter marinus TaxID=538382 RepID=A0ABW9UTL4_9SPHN|nr:uroporphyrinogen-III synthase [Pelagerythrobacter marinus]MXO67304.1 uroporphyrinogen-III synthase [Pelagerythrobacter marinus]
MSLPVVVIRPEPGLGASLAAARAAGLAVHGHPLAQVAPVAWDAPEAARFDGLLLGSANAVRHAGPALAGWRGRPAHVVGAATAATAREAGLAVETVGTGGLQAVVEGLRERAPLRLLRLAGRRHRALAPVAGLSIATCVVYEIVHCPVPPELAGRLRAGALVLLHSGEAARHFAAECDRRGIDRGAVALAALAPRIADLAGGGWRALGVAAEPSDAALLALARDMCH